MGDSVGQRTIDGYLDAIGNNQPAPGGGSVAGVVAALATSLSQMVISFTKDPNEELMNATGVLHDLRDRSMSLAADDELAYGRYIDASRMPKTTDEEKAARKTAMQQAMENSARVPLNLAVVAIEILNALEPVVLFGNKNLLADGEAAIVLAHATVDICAINVGINLPAIKDEQVADEIRTSIEAATEIIVHTAAERRAQINDRRIDSAIQ